MFGDGRRAQGERLRQFFDGCLPQRQTGQNGSSGGIREGCKSSAEIVRHLFYLMANYPIGKLARSNGIVKGFGLTDDGPNRNVWSATLSQAKNESDRMVCANV